MTKIIQQAAAETLRQPKALYLLVLVQMWECFSFYGMRVLLVLYMVNQLQFSDLRAIAIYAVYTGLVELTGVIGGLVADRLIGLRRAIALGGWLIAAGHICMALEGASNGFFFGLALIVVGSSLFSTNVSALLGLYYKQEDVRREAGYTWFYIGINIGGLLASILCGFVGEQFGWHYGFGLAAIGMIIGNILLLLFDSVLEDKGLPPVYMKITSYQLFPIMIILAICVVSGGLIYADLVIPLLPLVSLVCMGFVGYRLWESRTVTLSTLMTLILYLAALALFFAAEEQMGSSLMLFSERHVTREWFGIEVPSSVLMSVNPMTVILLGSCLTRLCGNLWGKSGTSGAFPYRIVIAFVLSALAFGGLAITCALNNAEGKEQMSVAILAGAFVLISLGEIIIGPAVYSFCSEVASEKTQGTVMGLVPIGFSLASFIGGYISTVLAVPEGSSYQPLEVYSSGFTLIAGLLIGFAVIFAVGIPVSQTYLNRQNKKVIA